MSSTLITNAEGTITDPTVNQFQSRQEQARLACERAGIVWPGTILPEGTALYTSGVENLKNDRAAWRRLPLASEVIGLVEAALKEEDRKDFPMDVSNLRFRPTDGRLVQANLIADPRPNFGLGYGDHTLRQLVAQIEKLDDAPKGFGTALIYLTDQERAEILNNRLDKQKPGTTVTLRTRLAHNTNSTRIARAALSERYGSVTDHNIAQAIGAVLRDSGDRTGRLDYKPGDTASRFEVIYPSEIPVHTFVVGDVHYALISISNSETGQGSIRIQVAVVRAACANLTLSTGRGVEVVIRHVGDTEKLVRQVVQAIRMALADLEPLISTIADAAQLILPPTLAPEKAFEAIAKKYKLAATTAVPLFKAQFEASQYPTSIFGLASAISEAAHKRDTWTDEAEWERVASDFQYKAVTAVRQGAGRSEAFNKALALDIEAVAV